MQQKLGLLGGLVMGQNTLFRSDQNIKQFSPLNDAPTEKPDESALVIGDSIVWNMKLRHQPPYSPLFTGSQSAWHLGKFKSAG